MPARLNVPWLVHLSGCATAPTSAAERAPLCRALAAALPELALFADAPVASRVPGVAFLGGAEGRTAAAHLARARRAVGSLDYPTVGALTAALQAWGAEEQEDGGAGGTCCPLRQYGAAQPSARVQLLLATALLGVSRRAGFAAAARRCAQLPSPLLAAALALPDCSASLLPAYAALQQGGQAAVRAVVEAHERVTSVCEGEAPAESLQGLRVTALLAALAAQLCLRAGAPCTQRSVQPHPTDAVGRACMAHMTGKLLRADAPALLSLSASREVHAALLRAACARAHPLFDLDVVGPRRLRTSTIESDNLYDLLTAATMRLAALAGWSASPEQLMAALAEDEELRNGDRALLRELAGRWGEPPALHVRGLAPALRRTLQGGCADVARDVVAALRALFRAARMDCAPYDGDERGVVTIDAVPLHAALRAEPHAGAALRELCETLSVQRLSSATAELVWDAA